MDMDLDDLDLTDEPSRVTTSSRPSRFIPKSSKLKPIPKSEPVIVPESEKTLILPKQEVVELILLKNEAKNEQEGFKPGEEFKEEVESKELVESMEVDNHEEENDEDEVVREIDVFFKPSPIDVDTQLYVLQYPLRPSWRPYDMDRKCQEVRVKPKKVQVEIDLSLEMDENYDNTIKDQHLRITKQTLLSQKVPLTRACAVGVLVGNKLHLNPVNAAVQLRPSMEHVIPDGSKKKNSVEATVKSEKTTGGPGPSRTQGNVRPLNGQDIDVDEPWVSLEYNGMDSIFSDRFRQKMTSEENTPIQFSMNPYDYVNALCPPTPIEDNKSKSPLRRLCMSLPLEEKFKKWFTEGDQVNRFASIKYIAPYDPEEIVLEEIQRNAYLVQGLWVCKTNLLPLKGAEAAARDLILNLFRKSDLIPEKIVLEEAGLNKDSVKGIMTSIAVYRDKCHDWKFKVPTDLSFIKDHPEIVKEQENLWGSREKRFMEMKKNERSMRNKQKPIMATNRAVSGNTDSGVKKSVNETVSMSNETREALPKVLEEEIFREQKICSLQYIRHRLRRLAISQTARPKLHPRTLRAAALGADIPPSELGPVISQVATNIHGVYVAKSSENTTPNLRDVVVQLFSAKEPHAKLKKAEISAAAKIALKREMTNAEYQQVTGELCVSVKGNAWILKPGDGPVGDAT